MRRHLFATAIALAALALTAGAAYGDPGPVELRLTAPATAAIGDVVSVQVTIVDADGEPVAGARLLLSERVSFLDAKPESAAVAGATSDAAGVAVITFLARREGTRSLTVSYAGDAAHAPASVTIELPVAPGGPVYHVELPSSIPGVNRFLVIGVLVAVWGTMLIVALHVVGIAREGAADAATDPADPAAEARS